MARPSAGRTCRIDVRLTPAEAAALAARADAAGLSLSDYVRQRALGGETTRARARPVPGEVAAVIRQLAAVGNNLNQLVMRYHQSDRPPPAALVELCLAEIRQVIRELAP